MRRSLAPGAAAAVAALAGCAAHPDVGRRPAGAGPAGGAPGRRRRVHRRRAGRRARPPAQVVQGFLARRRGLPRTTTRWPASTSPTGPRSRWRPAAETVVHDGGAPSGRGGPGRRLGRRAGDRGGPDRRRGHLPAHAPAARDLAQLPHRAAGRRVAHRGARGRAAALPARRQPGLSARSRSTSCRRPATRWSPDTVLVPELAGLPTKVVSRLLRGPTTALRGAVLTGLPAGDAARGAVGPGAATALATVPLDDAALSADQDAARADVGADRLDPQAARVRDRPGADHRGRRRPGACRGAPRTRTATPG